MKSNRKNRAKNSAETASALDPTAFLEAVRFADAVASGELADQVDPSSRGVNLQQEDGSISEIRLTNTPFNRVMCAVIERFRASGEALSAGTRFFALCDMMKDVSDELEETAIRVAAHWPVKLGGSFNRKQFLQAVADARPQ